MGDDGARPLGGGVADAPHVLSHQNSSIWVKPWGFQFFLGGTLVPRQTDGRTDGFAITISRSACIGMLTRDKNRSVGRFSKVMDKSILVYAFMNQTVFSSCSLCMICARSMLHNVHTGMYS